MRLNNQNPSIIHQPITDQGGGAAEGSSTTASESAHASVQPQANFSIPLKVTVGGRFFLPGIPKKPLNDPDRQLLHSLLTPAANAPSKVDENGILSYTANHYQPGLPPSTFWFR